MTQSKATEFINYMREKGVETAFYNQIKGLDADRRKDKKAGFGTLTMFSFVSMLRNDDDNRLCRPDEYMTMALKSFDRIGPLSEELRHRFKMFDLDWQSRCNQMTENEVEGERND